MFNNDWDALLKDEIEKDYFKNIMSFLDDEYQKKPVYPARENIFSALKTTAYKDVKVVILGQDPYHEPNQAHGLAFSVLPGVTPPPSLRNIFKELQSDLDCYIPDNGYLVKWARQGVLMLNAVLTVGGGEANSHSKIGWDKFTDKIIKLLNSRPDPIVFLLWGASARKKLELITSPVHYALESVHPSPLSAQRGFMGCKHFSKTNMILERINKSPIDWQIENPNN